MTKLTIELDIEISEGEEVNAVLEGYFKHQSHIKGRKVLGFSIIENQTSESSEEEDLEDGKNNSQVADRLAKARAAKAAKRLAELKKV